MAKTVTTDVETLREYLVASGLDAAAPKFPALQLEHDRKLVDGDLDDVFAELRPALLRQDLWELALPDWYTTKYSYGLQHKAKIRDRLGRRAFPETLRLQLDGEVRALPNEALLALVGALGLVPGDRIVDTSAVEEPSHDEGLPRTVRQLSASAGS